MERFLVCNNRKCRFILDRRIDGRSQDAAELILKTCPACGGDWSSKCPSCSQAVAIRLIGGLPQYVCCDRKPSAAARAA